MRGGENSKLECSVPVKPRQLDVVCTEPPRTVQQIPTQYFVRTQCAACRTD